MILEFTDLQEWIIEGRQRGLKIIKSNPTHQNPFTEYRYIGEDCKTYGIYTLKGDIGVGLIYDQPLKE